MRQKAELPNAVVEYVEKTGGKPYFLVKSDIDVRTVFVSLDDTEQIAIFSWDNPDSVRPPIVLLADTLDEERKAFSNRHIPTNEL